MTARIIKKSSPKLGRIMDVLYTHARLKVGIIGDEVFEAKAVRDGITSVLTVGQVAEIHEFGSLDGTIPERSFIRGYYDLNGMAMKKQFVKEIKKAANGTQTAEVAYNRVGLYVQDGVQTRIEAGIPPALAPSTIERKGSSKPLIDTGQLKSSITYAVAIEEVPHDDLV